MAKPLMMLAIPAIGMTALQSLTGLLVTALCFPVLKKVDLLRVLLAHSFCTGATLGESITFAKRLSAWNKRWTVLMRG